jgi:O-antigen/teichoic acid export membrane protein
MMAGSDLNRLLQLDRLAFLRSRWAISAYTNVLATVAVAVSGLANVIVLAHHVDLVLFGAIGLSVLLMNGIAAFDGIRPVIILRWADPDEPKHNLFGSVLLYSMATGGVVGIGALLIAWNSGFGFGTAVILGCACMLHFPASGIASFLDALKDTLYTGTTRSLGWCLVYSVFMGLALGGTGLWAYLSALVLFQLALIALYALRLSKNSDVTMSMAERDFAQIARIARATVDVLGFNLAAVVLGIADRLAVNALVGVQAYGLYAGPYDLAVRPNAIFRVLATVSLPELVHRGARAFTGQWWVLLVATFWLTSIVSITTAAFSETVVVFALGKTFSASATSFGLLVGTLPFFALSYFGAVLCQATGEFRLQRQVFVWGALGFIVVLAPLVLSHGLEGAALAVVLARFVDPVLIGLLLNRLGLRVAYWQCSAALAVYLVALFLAITGWLIEAAVVMVLLSVLLARLLSSLRPANPDREASKCDGEQT